MLMFLLVNVALLAFFFAPLAITRHGAIGRWYAVLLGHLWASNNHRAQALVIIAVIVTIEVILAPMLIGLPESPVVVGVKDAGDSVNQAMTEQDVNWRQALDRLSGGLVSAALPNETKKKGDESSSVSWVWFGAPLFLWPTAIIYLIAAYREEAAFGLMALLSSLKKSRTVSATAVSGADAAKEAKPEGTAGEKKSSHWWSPKWWLEYMLDDLLSDIMVEEGMRLARNVFKRA